MKNLFLLFVLAPLVEIYFLIKVGGWLGAGMTIFLVVATAGVGAVLVRAQGFAMFMRAREQMLQGRVPAGAMIEGVMLFIAGALLLTPGFLTDAVGFILLTPPLRRRILRAFVARATGYAPDDSRAPRGRVIDMERDD